jgi:hypothetical protein
LREVNSKLLADEELVDPLVGHGGADRPVD